MALPHLVAASAAPTAAVMAEAVAVAVALVRASRAGVRTQPLEPAALAKVATAAVAAATASPISAPLVDSAIAAAGR